MRMLPPVPGGEFAGILADCRKAALELYARLRSDDRWITIMPPELDIVVWTLKGPDTRTVSESARSFFKLAEANQLYLSLFQYPTSKLPPSPDGPIVNTEYITCLRACLMKPEHLSWIDELWERIMRTMDHPDVKKSLTHV